ncbi:hypothetical protein L1049_008288 [Liquidambar formosana]|uniref:tRNA(His) guanylyltransferase n=1 Tax=Liquidambar formosana TaxID=63359 RepID=A0AAP0X872_LIQFO
MMSLIVSFFTSIYVIKWKEFFPQKELRYLPSFHARVISCATMEVLQAYLAWRQNDCHIYNQYNTCFWMLVKCGKAEREAQEILQGTQKQEKNELLFQQFGINYRKLPDMFRQGSCVFKTEVEVIVKYSENGTPIKRLQRKPMVVHSENISGRCFWNGHSSLLNELGGFGEHIGIINPEYVKSFQFGNKLMPSTWVVIRIDGRHFHRFSEDHEFEKPNDEQALNLMNSCAVAVLEEFQDIIFSYGLCSEEGFSVLSKACQILQDYLAWRQVDCHINNQYNTCFWMLVKSGKSKSEAQKYLKGSQAREKNELLIKQFSIDYNNLPIMFRQGSSVFWEKEDNIVVSEDGASVKKSTKKVIVEHCNIIEQSFWKAHPGILDEIARSCEEFNYFRESSELYSKVEGANRVEPASACVTLFSIFASKFWRTRTLFKILLFSFPLLLILIFVAPIG